MAHTQTFKDIKNLFGEHLLSISQPSMFGSLESREGVYAPTHLDMELLCKVVDQLEANGVNWKESVKIGDITKAYYQTEVKRLTDAGY